MFITLLERLRPSRRDRKSTRLNSSHSQISYAVFCLKKKKNTHTHCCAPLQILKTLHRKNIHRKSIVNATYQQTELSYFTSAHRAHLYAIVLLRSVF